MEQCLAQLRADYDRQAGRSVALPIAGAIIWTIAGIAALVLPVRAAALVLLFGSGAMFPLGLLLARLLGEKLLDNTNPLAKLMGLAVLMVNLLWALHVILPTRDIALFPLSLGIGLGLHWVVFSWIIAHPLGTIHALMRTGLATALWWLFPEQPQAAVAAGVVVAYLYSIVALANRKPNEVAKLQRA